MITIEILVNYALLLIGVVSAYLIGSNNNATSLGILFATNAIRRRQAYLLNMISLFLGVVIGSLTMLHSVYGLISGNQLYVTISIVSTLSSSIITFYYLNKSGIPSSLSQTFYPSLAVITLVSHSLLDLDWIRFWIVVLSWAISPISAILFSLFLYYVLSNVLTSEYRILRQIKIYKSLIMFSSAFTSFVVGANAIGIIVSSALVVFPTYIILPMFGLSASLGVISSRRIAIKVGFRVTKLGYLGASSAIIGSNVINEIFTFFGIPLSITQTIMGGIIGLSFRSFTSDVRKQVRQIIKSWTTSPLVAIVLSLAIFGIIKSILGL
ncbi:phosphate permease [Sulfolobus sp. A20]|uniref:inorganic phosphate transporter n=1 Tax=Saccharolobus sp. A20 TaxID=1891280 RepID=UPI000845DC1E|nr:inorganic phosphate transporter [Sulfolobus sp. A20]TRM78229.1 inorganic phosphate transporter [Sulfolobus sp. B5]TRM78373.1 inorganic phosphate transporter [Sulfolobus sp. A20-N-F8]TRM82040.1 inorganic phosphate transporter [Sulfolobus sp. A20-N-F6]TRM85384.1 inorganic phosphate transporter [Sulfolobus sp. F3]TRM89081.1 inorganic phosphate transporter [Sulfolobus sp. C3]TRM94517.1 inorganic phosphate transporter [Sulfolobus sp. A20-N-G8]TRN02653.1 inorganic phosphate transporter [Sulfolo